MSSKASEYTRALLLKDRDALESRKEAILNGGNLSPEVAQELIQVVNSINRNDLSLCELFGSVEVPPPVLSGPLTTGEFYLAYLRTMLSSYVRMGEWARPYIEALRFALGAAEEKIRREGL